MGINGRAGTGDRGVDWLAGPALTKPPLSILPALLFTANTSCCALLAHSAPADVYICVCWGGDLSIGGLSDMRAYVRDASVHIVISSKNIIMYCMCTWDARLVCARRGKKRASLECMCNKLLPLFAPHLLSISVCVV